MYQGEMPIEELMKMYSAAENESTDMQSDVESSQESSEEGTVGIAEWSTNKFFWWFLIIIIVFLICRNE